MAQALAAWTERQRQRAERVASPDGAGAWIARREGITRGTNQESDALFDEIEAHDGVEPAAQRVVRD